MTQAGNSSGASAPRCACHNEPMHRNGIERSGAQKYRCAVRQSRRVRMRIGLDMQAFLGTARDDEEFRVLKSFIQRRQEEVNARILA